MKNKKQYYLFASIAIFTLLGGLWFHVNDNQGFSRLSSPEVDGAQAFDVLRKPQRTLSDVDSLTPKVEVQPRQRGEVEISPADQYTIDQWEESLGESLELQLIYESYDFETLMQLANQGDVYALQQAAGSKELAKSEDYRERRAGMLSEAAARGSTYALFLAANLAEWELNSLQSGGINEEVIRRQYGLEDASVSTEQSLEVIAAANYVILGRRGSVHMEGVHLYHLQNKILKRDFIKKEWQDIFAYSDVIYQRLENERRALGLEEFDNSYPEAYATRYRYSKENTEHEDMLQFIDSH